jgi:DNA primase
MIDPDPLPETVLDGYRFPTKGWAKRGFSPEVVKEFELGYDPSKNDLTIPLRSCEGNLMGIIRRRPPGKLPKYTYPEGLPIGRYLFGSWKDFGVKVALVEGSLDAVSCWDAGVPALGLLGARVTADQTRTLVELGIRSAVLYLDNDSAGQKAKPGIYESLRHVGITVKTVNYSDDDGKDPGEISAERRAELYETATLYRVSRD